MWAAARPILEKKLPGIIKQAIAAGIPQKDSWVDETTALEQMLESAYGAFFDEDEIEEMVEMYAGLVSQFNHRDLARMLAIVGGTHALEESWLDPHLKSFVKENVKLIKSIKSQNLDQVSQVITKGIRNGERYETIMERLEQRPFNASRAKAALIARDQIGKFNGDLSRVRQQHAGIESYSWDTAHDERVRGNPRGIYPNARPSHWAQQGKVYSWSSSGAPGLGHPGDPIQCRCVARPAFDESGDEE